VSPSRACVELEAFHGLRSNHPGSHLAVSVLARPASQAVHLAEIHTIHGPC